MIDNPETVARLMEQMQAQLPIPALPSKGLVHMLRDKGLKIDRERVLFINQVFYLGDEGGIMCDVTPTRDAKEAIVASLTSLEN
jgi:hypothetical protein